LATTLAFVTASSSDVGYLNKKSIETLKYIMHIIVLYSIIIQPLLTQTAKPKKRLFLHGFVWLTFVLLGISESGSIAAVIWDWGSEGGQNSAVMLSSRDLGTD